MNFNAPARVGRYLKDLGQSIERAGLRMEGDIFHTDRISRHTRLLAINGESPTLSSGVFVAPNASVVGDVTLGENSSVFYGGVVRASPIQPIAIGDNSTIGDRAVVTGATSIGSKVVVAAGAILTSCNVGSNVKIGSGAIIPEGCRVEDNAAIGHGTVLLPGTHVKSGELWAGAPAKLERKLSDEEVSLITDEAEFVTLSLAAHTIATSKTLEDLVKERDEMYLSTRFDKPLPPSPTF